MEAPFGFVVIDKPAGLTSHDCVSRMRRVFGIKRVGHGGTLDPAVTGVLPIALGHATRLLPYLPGAKSYRGSIQLGQRTSSDDQQGDLISKQAWPELNTAEIETYLETFRGTIQQRPPQVSAVHVQGERAHARARRGETMEIPARTITIERLQLLSWNQQLGQLDFNVDCSSGTYIRSLARDLGELIGCGGCLGWLKRTQALGFHEQQAVPLPDRDNPSLTTPPAVLEPLTALAHLPRLQLNEEEQESWRCGRRITAHQDQCQPAPKPLASDQKESAPIETEASENEASDNETGESKPSESKPMLVVIGCRGEVAGMAYWEDSSTVKPKVVFNARG
ncbi:MAG: tRNA pseudouridine(55) synthase TruB [Prochlorococcaceae cyanobacterium ETNP18_MAG_1]|nr:tRNA pseudouridine(55) synthase TruB [Prochlorococcaceae cyanobacterium ETNP18_MAG_1]